MNDNGNVRVGFLRSFSQWCGSAEGQDEPLSERFLEFVTHMFRNSAYQSLYRSIICFRNFELCKPENQVSPSFLLGFSFEGGWLPARQPAVGASFTSAC